MPKSASRRAAVHRLGLALTTMTGWEFAGYWSFMVCIFLRSLLVVWGMGAGPCSGRSGRTRRPCSARDRGREPGPLGFGLSRIIDSWDEELPGWRLVGWV